MAIEQGVGDSTNYSPVLESIEDTLIEQTALEITLNSLTETLQELSARLMVIASMANSGQPALRTIPIASVSTAVTGTLTAVTTVGTVTNFGTGVPAKEVADDMNNVLVTLANIQNAQAT